jgi:fatty acid desaturase
MAVAKKERKIAWYRSSISREELSTLSQRSDWKGFVQTGGYLGLLLLTGGSAIYAAGHLPVWAVLLILYLHGTLFAFQINALHELVHKTVFKSKTLNSIFINIIGFIGWTSPVLFWASHQEHHKYTLHPPEDLEVVLPAPITLAMFLKSLLINPWYLVDRLRFDLRLAFGRLEGEWENYLFPPEAASQRQKLFGWARIHLIGHGLILVISLALGWWMVPVVLTLAQFYGGGLQFLLNNTQHTGLVDNTPDYRLCCRTILINPILRFIYWQMNYHTEHHMFASIPCYNLGKLHKSIRPNLPRCPGLVGAWKEIIEIQKRQKVDPTYQYAAELPD